MQPIKFRAWNKKLKHFVDVVDLKHYAVTLEGEIINFDYSGYDIIEHFELVQYTGLKDKSGVEIYEGDILVFSDPGNPNDIDYEEPDWRYSLDNNPIVVQKDDRGFRPFTDCSSGIDIDYIYPVEADFIKVIGNIWENEELLSDS